MGRRGGGGRIGGGGRSGGFGGGGRIGGGLSGSGRIGGSSGGRSGRGLGAVGRAPTTSRPPAMRSISSPRPSSSRSGPGFGTGLGVGLLAGNLLGGRRNSRRGFGGGGGILPDGGTMGGSVQGGRRGFGGCGCFSGCFSVIVVIVILIVVMSMFSQCTGENHSFFASTTATNITPSTISRTPLPQGSAREAGSLFTDHLGWIRNSNSLLPGMRSFFNETGVRPHLYITDNIDGNIRPNLQQMRDFAEQRYRDLFDDHAHMLLVFFENEGFADIYAMYIVVGAQAQSVMDYEAQNILMDMVQRYYYTNLSEEVMFSNAFESAGQRIMEITPIIVTTSPMIPFLIVVGIIIVLLVLFFWWKNRQEQKRDEAEQLERILNQPLETFNTTPSSETADRLAKRYTDNK